MITYSHHPCETCGSPSDSVFYEISTTPYETEQVQIRSFYCIRHYFAKNATLEREQVAQELMQWGDQDWYKDLFPEKFADSEDLLESLRNKKRSENMQINLFS